LHSASALSKAGFAYFGADVGNLGRSGFNFPRLPKGGRDGRNRPDATSPTQLKAPTVRGLPKTVS
jgi:hypothetical protein